VKYFKLPTIQFYTSSFFTIALYSNSDLRELLNQTFPSCLSRRVSVKVTGRIAAITTCCLSPLTRRRCAYGTLIYRPVTEMRPSFNVLRDYHRRAVEKNGILSQETQADVVGCHLTCTRGCSSHKKLKGIKIRLSDQAKIFKRDVVAFFA
jgi:hypothetical protein